MITLDNIDYQETLRYLGDKKVPMNSTMEMLMVQCEKEVLEIAQPRWLYKKLTIEGTGLLKGKFISKHLENCEDCVIMCATIGAQFDKLVRFAQVTDMAKAVILDAMGSVAVEQVCNKLDLIISQEYKDFNLTFRFSPGYGDYPIDLQKKFLTLLDASKKIGLCTNDSYLLTPTKSVTGIIGLSKHPVEKRRGNCVDCNLFKTCKFRKAGTRCEF